MTRLIFQPTVPSKLPGERVILFEFPLAAAAELLAASASHGAGFAESLRRQAMFQPVEIDIDESLASELAETGLGRAFCPGCGAWHAVPDLERSPWALDGVVAAAWGINWHCPAGHLLWQRCDGANY